MRSTLSARNGRIYGSGVSAMVSILKTLILHPLFWLGAGARATLTLAFDQKAFIEWYGPFLSSSLQVLSLDPWFWWVEAGGDYAAFPYGYVMWASLMPFQLPFRGLGQTGTEIAYFLALFCFDLLLLVLISKLVPGRLHLLLVGYWLSPIILVATYVLGLNDVIPAFFLILALCFTKENKLAWAGVALGAAISAKLSMAVALPLFLVFLSSNKYRAVVHRFFGGFVAMFVLSGIPFLVSENARVMLFGNPELQKVFALTFDSGQDVAVMVIPLLYALLTYTIWRVKRLNLEMFQATIGVVFLTIVLTTPPSFGWFLWVLPFLFFYQARGGRITSLLVSSFSLLYVVSALVSAPVTFSNGKELRVLDSLGVAGDTGVLLGSILHTLVVTVGIILASRMWRESVLRSNYFRSSRSPFVIGIAGDSGAGKDSFADALGGVLGTSSVARISGDDYHVWDRQKPMWRVMTHLNPAANDLERFWKDLSALADGRPVMAVHYDHRTGKGGSPTKVLSRDFIVCSGLHALYSPALLGLYDLKIYLDIDEELRRYLKIRRDTEVRGHSVQEVVRAIDKRIPDSKKFIRPQADAADLIFSLRPIYPLVLGETVGQHSLSLRLVVSARDGTQIESLRRALVGVGGLSVDSLPGPRENFVSLIVRADISAEDVAQIAKFLCPEMFDYLSLMPQWLGGSLGLMQLITIHHMNLALSRKLFT